MSTAAAHPATLGGIPTKGLDVPISAVFMACYLSAAVANVTIYRRNLKRNRRFRPSMMQYGFCMARLATLSLRIVWACFPLNTTIAIVANVLIAAGVILLWCLNLLFANRLFGEYHPRLYNEQPFSFALRRAPYSLVICCLPMLITAVVQEYSSPTQRILQIDGIILKVALGVFVAFTVSPLLVLLLTFLIPRRRGEKEVIELQRRLGTGPTSKKVAVISIAAALLIWELSIRLATILQTYSMANAPWYYSKPSFYIFLMGFELIVLTIFLVARVDRLFYAYGPNEQPEDGEREML